MTMRPSPVLFLRVVSQAMSSAIASVEAFGDLLYLQVGVVVSDCLGGDELLLRGVGIRESPGAEPGGLVGIEVLQTVLPLLRLSPGLHRGGFGPGVW